MCLLGQFLILKYGRSPSHFGDSGVLSYPGSFIRYNMLYWNGLQLEFRLREKLHELRFRVVDDAF
jgi:hypothetical protein